MEAYTKPPHLPALDVERRHGDERRIWSKAFLEYTYALVERPEYAGMPCTADDDGKLDWIIPTNRSPGSKNWDGNARRLEWWTAKAESLGIPVDGTWRSRTAKRIHPWGWKPCQTCGRWMRLSYAYPSLKTITTLNQSLPPEEQLDVADYLDIYEVAEHLVGVLGLTDAVRALAAALPPLAGIHPADLPALLQEIEEKAVRAELRGRLSPGAMSNPPDRLDGFHTYNLCCRSKQDTGRSVDDPQVATPAEVLGDSRGETLANQRVGVEAASSTTLNVLSVDQRSVGSLKNGEVVHERTSVGFAVDDARAANTRVRLSASEAPPRARVGLGWARASPRLRCTPQFTANT